MKSHKKRGSTSRLTGGSIVLICCALAFMTGCGSVGSDPSNREHGSDKAAESETPPVSDATFQSEVLESKTPVLVDFWAPWCGPCRKMSPVVDQFYADNKGKLKVFKLNVDENPVTAQKYQISGIPSLLLFKNGEVAEQIVGSVRKDRLVETFGKHLNAETTGKPQASETPHATE